MKKSMLLLAFATMIGTGAVNAQADPQPAKAQHEGKGKEKGNKPTPEEQAGRQAAHMQKKLGLSDDQKSKIEAFALTRIKANEELRGKARAAKDENEKKGYGKQMKANMETFDKDVNGVLTPEQQTKWKEMKEERKGDHKGHQGKHQGGEKKEGTEQN